MAHDRTKFDIAKSTLQIGGYHGGGQRDRLIERNLQPDFYSGQWIDLPGGGRFRLPTPYVRRLARLLVGGGQNTNIAPDVKYSTNAGGYRADLLLSADCPVMDTGLVQFGKLFDIPLPPDSMIYEARIKALNNIADQKAGIGEDLATFRQTVSLLKSPCSVLLSSLQFVKGHKPFWEFLGLSARQLRQRGPLTPAAEKYLEYVYGWKPLMQDIYGVIQLMKEQGKKSLLITGTGVSRDQREVPQVTGSDWSANNETILGPCKQHAVFKCKLWSRIDPNATTLRTLNQLGLVNPASLAWELIPWSFVVDWFVPIGPLLSALTAPAGLIFISGTDNFKVQLTGPYTHWYTGLGKVGVPATGTVQNLTYRRNPLDNWPVIAPYFSPNPFSGDRSLKALALAIAKLRW